MINAPEIRYLSKDDLKLLLKHKYLNVTQEDEVVKGICLWTEGQSLVNQQNQRELERDSLINSTNKRQAAEQNSLQGDLDEILMNVNWDFVSLPCLLDMVRNEPSIRQNKVFRQAMQAQLAVRNDRSSAEAIKLASSSFNSMPRFAYKHNKSQRNLYPTEADLEL